MKEILLTSSVLILALLALRRGVPPPGLPAGPSTRCGCWCWCGCWSPSACRERRFPVDGGGAGGSGGHRASGKRGHLSPAGGTGDPGLSELESPEDAPPVTVVRDGASDDVAAGDTPQTVPGKTAFAAEETDGSITYYARSLTVSQLLDIVWYAGMAIMALWLLITNLRFWRKAS